MGYNAFDMAGRTVTRIAEAPAEVLTATKKGGGQDGELGVQRSQCT